jgi:hypothetical protein
MKTRIVAIALFTIAIAILASAVALRAQTPNTLKLTNAAPQPNFDFALSNSGRLNVYQGSSAIETVFVTLTSGVSQAVALSCITPLPTGVSCSFNPATGNPSFSSALTITTSSTTAVGNYTITVVGTGSTHTHSAPFTLQVYTTVPLGGTTLQVDILSVLAPFLFAGLTVGAAGAVSVSLLRKYYRSR